MTSPREQPGLLRFLTAGSVDDGKSTLIGRLLYEGGGVYEDQLESVRLVSTKKNMPLDLSLITDGLKAEREQSITIDVAYRYFSTTKRKFIIADTPGHQQYTRNMVTGASTADLAVLLVDVRKGLLVQSLRHAYIVWLLGIRHIVLAVNKMDLVGFNQEQFLAIQHSFTSTCAHMQDLETLFVPVSALTGDGVVERSGNMPWYGGPSLLELLETVSIEQDHDREPFRFCVQSVIRPDQDFRGYAGQIISGTVNCGQEVVILPSGCKTRIERIILHQRSLDRALAPQSVLLTLADHVDVGRGDMLVDTQRKPAGVNHFTADLIWLSYVSLGRGLPYLIKHSAQLLCCSVMKIRHKFDIGSFENVETSTLSLNEIGTVEIVTHKPIFMDDYFSCRAMGSFILIDPANNETVAAGIAGRRPPLVAREAESAVVCDPLIEQSTGVIAWLTGMSGAGKTTICETARTELMARGFRVEVLDGDVVRKRLNSDLGFSRTDRDENVRRIGFIAQLLARHDVIVLVAAISPYRNARDEIRRTASNFLEVYVNAPLATCERRDPKGLYRQVRRKQIAGFTGIDDPYEPPLAPDVTCNTDRETIRASVNKVVAAILRSLNSHSADPDWKGSVSFPPRPGPPSEGSIHAGSED